MKFKNLLLILLIIAASSKSTYAITNFKDINKHWAETYIAGAASKGYVSGYEDGTFKPDKSLTYGEFSSMLVKLAKRDANIRMIDGDWASGFMTELFANKAIEKDDIAKSSTNLSRGAMALMAQRYMKARFDMEKQDKICTLRDLDSMDYFTRNAVETLWSLSLIRGDENNNFNSKRTITRAEACVIVMNLHSWIDKKTRKEI